MAEPFNAELAGGKLVSLHLVAQGGRLSTAEACELLKLAREAIDAVAAANDRCAAMVENYRSILFNNEAALGRRADQRTLDELSKLATAMRAGDADAPPTKTNSPA